MSSSHQQGTEISAETRYDRQVRLWGAATQQAIQRTLITFQHPSTQITGLCSEMAKIFVLAGVKSVIFDGLSCSSRIESAEAKMTGRNKCKSNFFIRENTSQNETGNHIGDGDMCVLKSLQELNPLVSVSEKRNGEAAAPGRASTNNNNVNIVHLSLSSVVEALKRVVPHQPAATTASLGGKRPREEAAIDTTAIVGKRRTWLLLQIGIYTVCHVVELETPEVDDLPLIFGQWIRHQIFPPKHLDISNNKPNHQLEALLSLPRATKMIGLVVLTLATLDGCTLAVRKLPHVHTMASLVHFNENGALELAAQAAGVEVSVGTWITDEDRSEVASVCTSIYTGKQCDNITSTIIDNSVGGSLLAQQVLNDVSTNHPTPTREADTAPCTIATFFSLVTSGANIEASCT